MAVQTLLKYVENVYVLELEQFTLLQIVNKLKQERSWKMNQIQKETVDRSYEYGIGMSQEISTTGAKVRIGIGIFFLIAGITTFDWASIVLFGVIAVVLIGWGAFTIWEANDIISSNARKYQEAKDKADTQLANIKKNNTNIKKICGQLDILIDEFEKRLETKKRTLQQMYDTNIVHNTYRNLYSMSKIYHVLDTGICNTLTGVEGAYSQIRVNEIIDNQHITIDLLRGIQETNQRMYGAITKTNELLGNMNQQMYVQNANNEQLLRDIKNNSEMANFLLQSEKNDREALVASSEYLAYVERQRRIAEGHWD
ncbi:MAG: DUF2892 domain-containing protein [Lachnospiraceae bacterium]|nr:DUF2892 domain-containing protein [Lachnospiraceae bacterium]